MKPQIPSETPRAAGSLRGQTATRGAENETLPRTEGAAQDALQGATRAGGISEHPPVLEELKSPNSYPLTKGLLLISEPDKRHTTFDIEPYPGKKSFKLRWWWSASETFTTEVEFSYASMVETCARHSDKPALLAAGKIALSAERGGDGFSIPAPPRQEISEKNRLDTELSRRRR